MKLSDTVIVYPALKLQESNTVALEYPNLL